MSVAYVLVNCDLGFEETIIDDLNHMEFVKEVHGTFGAYDIITKVEHAQAEKVREAITYNIRRLPHVRSTLTLMGIPGQS